MTLNPTDSYGVDLACLYDADAFFSDASGVDIVVQDMLHRITADSVLGPAGADWGRDVKSLLGMPSERLQAQQAIFAEVIRRDDRVETVDVIFTATTANGVADVLMQINGTTAAGPFALVLPVSEVTNATITGQAPNAGVAP